MIYLSIYLACLNSLEGRHAESELEAVRAMQRQNDIVAQSLHLAQGNLEKDEKAFQQVRTFLIPSVSMTNLI